MSRVSSLLLACVCAALLSASVSAQTLTITGNTTAGPLADGGTTYGMSQKTHEHASAERERE